MEFRLLAMPTSLVMCVHSGLKYLVIYVLGSVKSVMLVGRASMRPYVPIASRARTLIFWFAFLRLSASLRRLAVAAYSTLQG